MLSQSQRFKNCFGIFGTSTTDYQMILSLNSNPLLLSFCYLKELMLFSKQTELSTKSKLQLTQTLLELFSTAECISLKQDRLTEAVISQEIKREKAKVNSISYMTISHRSCNTI